MDRLKRALREPLLHFLLIGAGMFAIYGLAQRGSEESPQRIVVRADQVEQLRERFSRTWLRPPNERELDALIDELVRDEVYYREGLALGLDQDDPIIRRRLRQKLEFILEDVSAAAEPDDAELAAYLAENPERFAIPPRIAFRQIYLNPERRSDVQADARRLLAELERGAAPEGLGDPTMVGYEFAPADRQDIARLLGEDFAVQVIELEPAGWIGPIYSGYGAHLVRVTERREGRAPALDEVRAAVTRDWRAQRQRDLKDRAYQRLREDYEVVVEVPAAAAPGEASAAAGTDVAED